MKVLNQIVFTYIVIHFNLRESPSSPFVMGYLPCKRAVFRGGGDGLGGLPSHLNPP